jgi:hypothetical protein
MFSERKYNIFLTTFSKYLSFVNEINKYHKQNLYDTIKCHLPYIAFIINLTTEE